MPTVIREFARAGAGEVDVVTAGAFGSGELLTAVKNGSENLELIVWEPDASNLTLTRLNDSGDQAKEVGGIALAMLGQRCITAVQNGDGKLLLIPWALEPDQTISRLEYVDNQAGTATYVTIAALSDDVVVTPVRNGAGNLLIIPWRLETSGSITRLNTESGQGGAVSGGSTSVLGPSGYVYLPLEGPLIACAGIDGSDYVTAKTNKAGGLELAAWGLNSQFHSFDWAVAPLEEALADYLCMAPLGDPGPVRDIVLAYRKITPKLSVETITFEKEIEVELWRASTADQTLTKLCKASVNDMQSLNLAVGTLESGRPLIFLSGPNGSDELVNLAFEIIYDADRNAAVILTGKQEDESFEGINQIAPVALAPGRFATTLGHDDGFGLVAYNFSDLSATILRPLAEATAGAASAIRVRSIDPNQAIVALRNGSGNLQVIGWQLPPRDFAITREADTSDHSPIAAREVALVLVPQQGLKAVTAISSGQGNLRLDSWDVASDLSAITWIHQTGSAAGKADLITAVLLEPDLVVTAVRNGSGHLLIIVWRLEPDGTLSRLNHENAQAGDVQLISLTAIDSANVVTSVKDGSDNLLLIGWHIDTNGHVTRWQTDGHAGEVKEIATAALSGDGSDRNLVTAVRDGSDSLLLIAWRASTDERSIERLCDSGVEGHEGGDASEISVSICRTFPSARETIVTAERRDSGNLKLITWQLLDNPAGVPMLVETGEMTNRGDLDVKMTDQCALEPGRLLVAAYVGAKHTKGLWLGTMQVWDAQIAPAPANILELDFELKPTMHDPEWYNSGGNTYPGDRSFEWQQVEDARNEYDEQPMGVAGWIVKPEESGADVPFSHPFGFDWEFGIAVDPDYKPAISPANVRKEEEDESTNENGIALADQLGLDRPEGLLGLEWEKDLLPHSYRGQVNHGDRVAVIGRWIVDLGHDVDGHYRTEIHPPLMLATANVVQPDDGSIPRTRALFISRPFLSGQHYTDNLDTRYEDDLDDDGPLFHPKWGSHAFNQIVAVLEFQSSKIEMHSKIKEKPFKGNHHVEFIIRAPGPRPSREARLMVSYRFNTRGPCAVAVVADSDSDGPLVRVKVDINETGDDGKSAYQRPDLPERREETYSNDDLDKLSPGSGSTIGIGEYIIDFVSALLSLGYGAWVWYVLGKGIETDSFEPQAEFDILDRTGGVFDVPATQTTPDAGITTSNDMIYPVVGWLEAYWATPVKRRS